MSISSHVLININQIALEPKIWSFLNENIIANTLSGIFLTFIFFSIRDALNKRNNISGKWIMYETVINSDYNPFIGMRIESTVNILHSEKNISGSGEKYAEITISDGELVYPPKDKSKYSLEGNFEWRLFSKNIFRILLQIKGMGEARNISVYLSLKQISRDRLEGIFTSEAARSSGTVVLERTRNLSDFGKGWIFYFCVFFSKIFNIRLVENIEHHFLKNFARSKRIKNNISLLENILINIEDSSFLKHRGVSIPSLFRAMLSQFGFFRNKFKLIRSGGSTISMQLARTLFISDYHKTFRRKILEIFFALYLENILTKKEILKLYLSSVRYYHNTYGLMNAVAYFFPQSQNNLSQLQQEHYFFLIERLSNIKKNYSITRIRYLLSNLSKKGISLDYDKLIKIYESHNFCRID